MVCKQPLRPTQPPILGGTGCGNSVYIHNNSVFHYLYNMAVGLVIYSKARAYKAKAKAKSSRPTPSSENPKAKKFGLKAKAMY